MNPKSDKEDNFQQIASKSKGNESVPSVTLHSAPPLAQTPPEPETNDFGSVIKVSLILVAIALFGVLVLFYFSFSNKNPQMIIDLMIDEPLGENNEFRSFSLMNGIKVVLEKTNNGLSGIYFSMSVGVGNQNDPEEFNGLFDLLQKALIKGSKNFPTGNPIKKLVNKSGGHFDYEVKEFTTNYTYFIPVEIIEDLFARVADAVKNPSFSLERIEKSIQVNNDKLIFEYGQMRFRTFHKTLRKFINPKSKLLWQGLRIRDLKSLDLEYIRNLLIKFHDKFYSGNLISLSIISDQNLDWLEGIVKKHFSYIKNIETLRELNYKNEDERVPAFLPEVYGRIHYMSTTHTISTLHLITTVKSTLSKIDFQPIRFFEFLIKYFDTNSFQVKLEKKQYIHTLDINRIGVDQMDAIIQIRIELTDEGLDHIDEILQLFFQYVFYMSKIDLRARLHESMEMLSRYTFFTKNYSYFCPFIRIEEDMFERVRRNSQNMLNFRLTRILTSNKYWYSYNDHDFKAFLKNFQPKNMFYFILSKKFKVAKNLEPYKKEVLNGIETIKAPQLSTEEDAERLEEVRKSNEEKEENDTMQASIDPKKIRDELSRKLDLAPSGRKELKLISKRILSSQSKAARENRTTRREIEEINKLTRDIQSKKKMRHRLSRKLDEEILNREEEILENKIFETYFRKVTKKFKLRNYVDDYEQRKLHVVKIDEQDLDNLYEEIINKGVFFQKMMPQNREKLFQYKIITECPVPEILKEPIPAKTKLLNLGEVADPEAEAQEDEENNKYVSVYKILELLRISSKNLEFREHKIRLKKALLGWKICMFQEFENDDNQSYPNVLVESSKISLFHLMYRKSFQPRINLKVIFENRQLHELLLKNSYEENHKFRLKLILFENIIRTRLNNIIYPSLFTGGDVTMDFNGVNFRMTLSTTSHNMSSFLSEILKNIKMMEHEDLIEQSDLEFAIKKIEKSMYWTPKAFSPDQATETLSAIFNGFKVSWNQKEKIANHIDYMKKITILELTKIYKNYFKNSKMTLFFVGNLTSQTAMKFTEKFEKALFDSSSQNEDKVEHFSESGQESLTYKIFEHFSFKFVDDVKHYVVRNQNLDPASVECTYLTFFYDAHKDIPRMLMMFMLIEYIEEPLKKFLYDLGEKKYDTEMSKETHNLIQGLKIMVYSRSIDPIKMEIHMDKFLRKSLYEGIQNMSSTDFKSLLERALTNRVDYKEDVNDIIDKQYTLSWIRKFMHKDIDFYTAADRLTQSTFFDYVETLLIKKQRRVTIEVFKDLDEEKKKFRNETANMLGDIQYEIIEEKMLDSILVDQLSNK